MKKKRGLATRVLCLLLLVILSPILLLSFFFKCLKKSFKYSKWKKQKYSIQDFLDKAELEFVDVMQGYEFENFLKTMFFYLGYDALVTKRSGDYGADLVLKKDGQVYAIQAKRYTKNVGSKCVQEVLASMKHYQADIPMVITNSHFTKQAEIMASENNVILVDRNELAILISQAKDKIEEDYNLKAGQEEFALNENFDANYKFRI